MPKGYAIFIETIRDQAGYDSYLEHSRTVTPEFGGRPIVVDDGAELLEGEWPGSRTVILEFDSPDAARRWYRSPEYQALIGERLASADAHAVIVEGFEPPTG